MGEVEEAEVLHPLEIHYSDLLLLSSSPPPSRLSSSGEEHGRMESIMTRIMEALGPSGPGLLSVIGVPQAPRLRRTLLPLSRKLALLSNTDRARILKDHGLGSDVPLKNLDRTVSSFALQLKYGQNPSYGTILNGLPSPNEGTNCVVQIRENLKMDRPVGSQYSEFEMLGSTFNELGLCMTELGLHLARICDKVIGGQELENSILESCSAKGRLIHYHSTLDNHILREFTKKAKRSKRKPSISSPLLSPISKVGDKVLSNPSNRLHDTEPLLKQLSRNTKTTGIRTSLSDLWQQWHYDYGIFTILTTPMFLSSCNIPTIEMGDCSILNDQECSPPDGHTYLQLFECTKNKILMVKSQPESFIIQMGESADILSRGKLRSTLHSVCKPDSLENISRETFVVFMQPAWDKTLYLPEYSLTDEIRGQESFIHGEGLSGGCIKKNESDSEAAEYQGLHALKQEILKLVPPLASRLKDGMTFAEFSRETTRQYYGGSGMQSRR